MRSLKDIHPQYAEDVDFYVVNVDPSDTFPSLNAFAEREGYPWPIVQPEGETLANFKVNVQSIKVAFGPDGVIVYRAGFGGGNPEEWRALFEELSG